MIILGLLLTIFIYIFFPLLYKSHKGKISFLKALLLSVINSLLCTIILLIFAKYGAGVNMADYISRYLPVFIVYFIVFSLIDLAILTKKKKTKTEDEKPENNEENGDGLAETDKTRSE